MKTKKNIIKINNCGDASLLTEMLTYLLLFTTIKLCHELHCLLEFARKLNGDWDGRFVAFFDLQLFEIPDLEDSIRGGEFFF